MDFLLKNKQNLKIILTFTILLVGGYYVNKSVSTTDLLSNITEQAKADVPVTPYK